LDSLVIIYFIIFIFSLTLLDLQQYFQAHWWNICINVFFPLLLYRWRIYRERRQLKKQLRSLELEEIEEFGSSKHNSMSEEERVERKKHLVNKRILLEHAQVDLWEEIMLPEHDSFTEYLFAVTQFAYVCCFSVVLPITPAIVLINHLVNMRLDAFKLCRGRRRPLAVQTGGIGVWNHVLHIVTVIAILTNCALMALTTSQLRGLKDQFTKFGVFALSIGVEHFLLLVKYIMQLSYSRLPSSVENEIKRKKYDQERKRYKSLRMKKRSRSSNGAKNFGNEHHNDDNSGDTLKMSPFPPIIQEASTDISHGTAAAAEETVQEIVQHHDAGVVSSSKRAGLVDVRALARHSPRQHDEGHLNGSTLANTAKTRRNKHSRESSRLSDQSENADPNFDEHRQPPPESSNAFTNSQFNLLQERDKAASKSKTPLSTLYLDACSSIETHSSKSWRPSENAFSPDSSISTLPTPCHLRMESPDSQCEDEVQMATRSSSYYQYASAPPMPPNGETDDLTNDEDDDAPKAKWAVYHSFQYNRSAQKEKILRSKKSR
jgi:hypothetical protein